VSEAEKVRHIVTNQQNQPVELHLPSGLIVLPPRGRTELSETDLSAPQLQVLRASRLIALHEVAQAPEAEAAAEEAANAEDATEPQAAAGDQTRDAVQERKSKTGRKP
jgi:hypothetical protein